MRVINSWLREADVVKTTKYGGTITPRFIVMHYTAGWTDSGDINTLAHSNAKVSCHLHVSRTSKIVQMVPFNRRAWHAGPSRSHGFTDLNSHSIGIEIANHGWIKKVGPDRYKDQYGRTLDGDGRDVNTGKQISETPVNSWSQHSHKNLGKGEFVWEPYPDGQLEVIEQIVEALFEEYPSIRWIVGHEEIDTRGWKTDPGPEFPMKRFTRLIDNRESNDHEVQTVYLTTDELNVRSSPKMGDNRIDTIPEGSVVVVDDHEGNWRHIRYDKDLKSSGWVFHRYLKPQL